MLAKGRLLGVQFQAMLEDDLWLQMASHANRLAEKLSQGIQKAGYSLYVASPTNQIFPILPKEKIEALAQDFSFEFTAHVDENSDAIRLVTSWATEEAQVDAFLKALINA